MPKKLSDFAATVSKDRSPAIRKYLKALGARYVDERELCAAVRLGYQQLAKYRPLFTQHLVPYRNKAGRPAHLWAGTARLAKQMRELAHG